MSQDNARQEPRIPYTGRVLLRGACGHFVALGEDISRSGIQLAIPAEVLRMDPDADLTAAAACVQTRVGSRFAIDLGLTAAGRGRVRKTVELVRLVLDANEEGDLGLGCVFLEALTAREAESLSVEWPDEQEKSGDPVRREESWADGGRATLDPRLGEEKVESLLGVPVAPRDRRTVVRSDRELRALMRSTVASGEAPLVGVAFGFSEVTVRVRLSESELLRFGSEPGDFTGLARGMQEAYGEWPELEILDGTRRLWHGAAHPCGLELTSGGEGGAVLRLSFGRRLQAADLERLCA